jgi:polyferredoxin
MQNETIRPDFLLQLTAADVILLLHVLFVGFVVLGLALIVAGGLRGWSWVRNPWFRVAHVVAIGIVVVQSWFGAMCPLTIWEMALRSRAEGTTYSGTFIGYWLGRILYYQAPAWAFVVSYTLFGVLVVACWFWIRPRPLGGIRRV